MKIHSSLLVCVRTRDTQYIIYLQCSLWMFKIKIVTLRLVSIVEHMLNKTSKPFLNIVNRNFIFPYRIIKFIYMRSLRSASLVYHYVRFTVTYNFTLVSCLILFVDILYIALHVSC